MFWPSASAPQSVPASGSPPAVKIGFYYPSSALHRVPDGTYVGLWVQVYWASEPEIVEWLYNKGPSRGWPYNDETELSSWRFCSTTPIQWVMPDAAWQALRHHTRLYWIAIAATIQDKYNSGYLSAWEPISQPHQLELKRTAPVADAGLGRPYFIDYVTGGQLAENLVLDGSRSYDPDGDPLIYQWQLTAGVCTTSLPWGPAQSAQSIALTAGTPVPRECLGTYWFTLTVTDTLGASSTAQVQHTLATYNHAPVANAGAAGRWLLGKGYRLLND